MIRYFPLLILMISYSPKNEDCLEQLNKELGAEYAEPLNELVNEFELLAMNSNGSDFANKCRNFLKPLATGNDKKFYSRITKRDELVNVVAGLDTMIFKYEYYQSDCTSTRKYISNKWNSIFIKSLSNLTECDDLISEYLKMIKETGGIGPVLIAEGAIFNYSDEDFNNPIIKRILAVEILLPYLTFNPEQN